MSPSPQDVIPKSPLPGLGGGPFSIESKSSRGVVEIDSSCPPRMLASTSPGGTLAEKSKFSLAVGELAAVAEVPKKRQFSLPSRRSYEVSQREPARINSSRLALTQ